MTMLGINVSHGSVNSSEIDNELIELIDKGNVEKLYNEFISNNTMYVRKGGAGTNKIYYVSYATHTLLTAANRGNVDAIEAALYYPNTDAGFNDFEVLHLAAENGYLDCVLVLMEHPGIAQYMRNNFELFFEEHPLIRNAFSHDPQFKGEFAKRIIANDFHAPKAPKIDISDEVFNQANNVYAPHANSKLKEVKTVSMDIEQKDIFEKPVISKKKNIANL